MPPGITPRIYKISHNTDGEKVTTITGNAEFINFVRRIAVENEVSELSIIHLGEAMEYLENYCPNLTLL